MTKLVLAAIFKQNIFFFKFYFKNVKVFVFSYFESKFTEKFLRKSVFFFFNFAHVTIFAKTKIRFLAAILKQNIFWTFFWPSPCFDWFTILSVYIVGLTQLDVLMEVAYSCNFLAVSDSSTCPDIGTSWCHAGIIEHFEIRGFKMTP